MKNITSCFWFDDQAEEAVIFYTSIFKDSSTGNISRYGKEGYEFQLKDQHLVALNGGLAFQFNEAISFQVPCETQEELDYYWEKLSEGRDEKAWQCGWLKDKYGVSWQIIPVNLGEMLNDHDSAGSQRVMKALYPMSNSGIAKRLLSVDHIQPQQNRR